LVAPEQVFFFQAILVSPVCHYVNAAYSFIHLQPTTYNFVDCQLRSVEHSLFW